MTRQREAFYTAMENWTKVTDLATISANSFGTAEEKMLAYSEGLEAAQKRVTVALESWALKDTWTNVLTKLNELLAFLIENADTLAISLGTLGAVLGSSSLKNLFIDVSGGISKKIMSRGIKKSATGKNFNELQENLLNLASNIVQGNAEKSLGSYINKQVKKKNNSFSEEAGKVITEGFSALFNSDTINKLNNDNKFSDLKQQINSWFNNGSQAFKDINEQELRNSLEKLTGSADKATKAFQMLTSEVDNNTRKVIQQQGNYIESNQNISGNKLFLQGLLEMASTGLGAYAGFGLGGRYAENFGLDEGDGSIIGSAALGGFSEFLNSGVLESFGQKMVSRGILPGLGTALTSAFAGPIASIAISGAFAIWNLIKASAEKKRQEAIKEATEAAAEAEESYKSAITSTSQVERYDELAKGVDSLGRNVSLTEEEYQEFLDTSNSLAAIFPELVVRTDDMGNSLLGIDGKVGQVTDSIEKMTEAMQRAYNTSLIDENYAGPELENAQKAIMDAQNKIAKSQEKINQIRNEQEQYAAITDMKAESQDTYELFKSHGIDVSNMVQEGNVAINIGSSDYIKEIQKLLSDQGILDYNNRVGGLDSYLFVTKDDEEKALSIINEYLQSNNDLMNEFNTYSEEAKDKITELEDATRAEYQAIEEAQKALEPIVSAQIQRAIGEENWNTFTEEQQQMMTSAISSIDLFKTDENGNKVKKSFEEYQKDIINMVDELQMIMADPDNSVIIEAMFEDDSAKTAEEATKIRNSFANLLLQSLPENASIDDKNKILIPFGFEYTERGIEDTGNIRTQLAERGLTGVNYYELGQVNIDTLRYAYENLDESILSSIKTINQFYDVVNSEKLNQDNLAFFVSEYERLSKMNLLPDSSEQRYLNQIIDKLKVYATVLGYSTEDWEKTVQILKQVPDSTLIGTSDQSFDDVSEQYSDFQTMYDYFSSEDYSGEVGIDIAKLVEKYAETTDILKYLAANDTKGLLNYLDSYIGVGDDNLTNRYQGLLANDEEAKEVLMENNQELVDDLIEKYNLDLNYFSTIAAAKEVITLTANGDIQKAWATCNAELDRIYGDDLANFSAKQAAKMAQLSAIAGVMGRMSYDEFAAGYKQASAKGEIYRPFGENGIGLYDSNLTDLDIQSAYEKLYATRPMTDTEKEEAIKNSVKEFEDLAKMLNTSSLKVSNSGVSSGGSGSSGGSEDEGPTEEELLDAMKSLIDKEYEAMIVFDEKNLKQVKDTEYFNKMRDILQQQRNYYEAQLKTDLAEDERLDIMQKLQSVKVEIANLDDEEIQDEMTIAQLKEATLGTQIDIQRRLLKTSDTEEEMLQNQQTLNDLLKQEYDLRVSINNFQMEKLQREMDFVDVESAEYESLMQQQIKEAQNNVEEALNQMQIIRDRLTNQYASELNAEGNRKYTNAQIEEMVENSEEMQELYQTYIEAIDKQVELVLNQADKRIEKIENRIDTLEMMKPQEWSSMEQIIGFSDKNIELLRSKILVLEEILSNTAGMTIEQIQSYTDAYNQAVKDMHEAEIQKQQDLVDYQDRIYDALTWQVQEYIDQIEKQKEIVEDYYDTEIDKLEKVNAAKERTIELEKLQDALMNARKEKQRVNLDMPSIKIAV